MSESATDRVRGALAAGEKPARKDIEHALRESFGFTARQARRFAAEGAKGIVNDDDATTDITERLAALERVMRV